MLYYAMVMLIKWVHEIRVQLIQNIWALFGLQITVIIAILMVTAHECGNKYEREKNIYRNRLGADQ